MSHPEATAGETDIGTQQGFDLVVERGVGRFPGACGGLRILDGKCGQAEAGGQAGGDEKQARDDAGS